MPKQPKAVREDESTIEIDARKGAWPYLKAARGADDALLLYLDSNEGGQVINEGQNKAMLILTAKKAKRLREFLERTEGLGL